MWKLEWEKWEQNPIKCAYKPRKAIASFRVLVWSLGHRGAVMDHSLGNKMKAMGLLLHKIRLHLYTQNFHKTLEVHGPLRDPEPQMKTSPNSTLQKINILAEAAH